MYIALGIVILIGMIVGLLAYQNYSNDQTVVSAFNETIDRPELDLAFTYPSGDFGFSLIEPPVTEGGELLKAFILMPTKDFVEFSERTEPGESPPTISIFVFDMPDSANSATSTMSELSSTTSEDRPDRISRLQSWAMENTVLTSYASALATPEVVEVDGLKMFHYRADGLYQQDIYLASYKGRAYMFAAQFDSEENSTFTAFQELITKVSFN